MQKIPKRFWQDSRWAEEHYSKIQEKYPDQWIAIFNKKIVSFGKNIKDVERNAEKITKKPKEQIPIVYVECGGHIY